MNWEQFLTEFVLRALTQIEVLSSGDKEYYLQVSLHTAREAWDAMQAAELPESEKAKQAPITTELSKNMANSPKDMDNSPDLKPSNSTELRALAELAKSKGFAWIAQDDTGVWWGYKVKPRFRKQSQDWHSDDSHFAALNLPDDTDYSKQIFNVKQILNNE